MKKITRGLLVDFNNVRIEESKKILSGEVFYAACKSRLDEKIKRKVK